jgi:hypothetical protein
MTMTLDELRDAHAKRLGWYQIRANGATKEDGNDGLYWAKGGRMMWDHPVPDTLDAAWASVPPGWVVRIFSKDNRTRVELDTPEGWTRALVINASPIHAIFEASMKAWEAEAKGAK